MTSLNVFSLRNKKAVTTAITSLIFFIGNSDCGSSRMNEYCHKKISLITQRVDQLKLELDDDGIYGKTRGLYPSMTYFNCETKIEAWYKTYPKLMFYFEHLDLDCGDGHLEFYEGETGGARVFGLAGDICGHKPDGVYAVDTRYIRIKYVPTRKQYLSNISTIIITPFSGGYCSDLKHECKNSRCIDKSIACNEYDSCGDGSGCDDNTDGTDRSSGLVTGSLVGFVCVVCLILCCIFCTRTSGNKPEEEQSTGQTQVSRTSSSRQEFGRVSYIVDHGTSFPCIFSTNIPPAQQQADFYRDNSAPPAYEDIFGTPGQIATGK